MQKLTPNTCLCIIIVPSKTHTHTLSLIAPTCGWMSAIKPEYITSSPVLLQENEEKNRCCAIVTWNSNTQAYIQHNQQTYTLTTTTTSERARETSKEIKWGVSGRDELQPSATELSDSSQWAQFDRSPNDDILFRLLFAAMSPLSLPLPSPRSHSLRQGFFSPFGARKDEWTIMMGNDYDDHDDDWSWYNEDES